MAKQSKITVKHFLNTNLKPYVINGVSHYSIYILLTAKRQNTKIKSIIFDELYSENDFEDIISLKDDEDRVMLQNEIFAFENISDIVITDLKEFDTHFISAYSNFIRNFDLWDSEAYERTNVINFQDFLHTKINGITQKSISLFDFFGKEQQEDLQNFLVKTKSNALISNINRVFFYYSLDKFKYFLQGSVRNKMLLEKYNWLINDFELALSNSITTT